MYVCGLLHCHVGSFIFVRVDGGVTNNDFIMQMLSDLTQLNVDRPVHSDMAALGAAFLAGLATGKQSNFDDYSTYTCEAQKQIPKNCLKRYHLTLCMMLNIRVRI